MRFVEIGVIFLSLALLFSFTGPFIIDPPTRLVDLLWANPQRYLEYIFQAFVFLVLPSIIGISFVIFGYTKKKEGTAEISPQWALAIIAGVFLVWGILYISFDYGAYQNAMRTLHNIRIEGLENLVVAIYATVLLAGGLLVLAGLLVLYLPLKTLYARLRGQNEKPSVITSI